jgi:hypothetical protein
VFLCRELNADFIYSVVLSGGNDSQLNKAVQICDQFLHMRNTVFFLLFVQCSTWSVKKSCSVTCGVENERQLLFDERRGSGSSKIREFKAKLCNGRAVN